MQMSGYFDNCATTKPCERAILRMNQVTQNTWGNPSSLYDFGVTSENLLQQAREKISDIIFCRTDEVFFTSGGTEANNIAVFGTAKALARRGKRIVTTAIEHASVIEPINELEQQGFEVIRLPVDKNGQVNEADINAAITRDTILVSMMLINNETGAIADIPAISRAIKAVGAPALLHCDCVQAFMKMPFKMNTLGADLITISAHKIHGVAGVGALIKRKGAHILPHTFGGSQESAVRPGTQSVALIAAFLGAMENMKSEDKAIQNMQSYTKEKLIKMQGIKINSPENASPYIINISVSGIRSETMLHFLEAKGIYISSGSACSKGKGSYVLKETGLNQNDIDSAIRISFSHNNNTDEIDALCDGIYEATQKLTRRIVI